jgi:hypothetical protein
VARYRDKAKLQTVKLKLNTGARLEVDQYRIRYWPKGARKARQLTHFEVARLFVEREENGDG